jgi:hypothetical protein
MQPQHFPIIDVSFIDVAQRQQQPHLLELPCQGCFRGRSSVLLVTPHITRRRLVHQQLL